MMRKYVEGRTEGLGRHAAQFAVLRRSDGLWVVLYNLKSVPCFQAWSLNSDLVVTSSETELIASIVDTINEQEGIGEILRMLIQTASGGWEYWGSGIPAPLSSRWNSERIAEEAAVAPLLSISES